MSIRFSLRTLFLLTTAVGVFCGAWIYPAVKQKAAREWVLTQGGHITFDYHYDAQRDSFDRRAQPPAPEWAIEWFGIDLFARVTHVELDRDDIHDLDPLSDLPQLKELYVNIFVSPEVDLAASLQAIPQLEVLHLSLWSGIDSSQAAALRKKLPNVHIVCESDPSYQP